MGLDMKEFLILAGRMITILPLMLAATLFMGRRSIGELPVFDFLILLALGAVVGADIADPNIEHIHTAVAIILIGLLQKLVAVVKLKSRKIGKLLTFEPVIVIKDGVIIHKHLEDIQYSIDNLMLMLREKDVFNIDHVELAIIEGNGKLTVMKKPSKEPVTAGDLHIQKAGADISYPVVVDGKLYEEVLDFLQADPVWFVEKLQSAGVKNIEEVFFAAIDKERKITLSLKEKPSKDLPPVIH
ncbi:DUF421 domain-containing protein [Bacillus thermotolerans]|uniref:YetF C-terminal domain-containing protein n=1 Tax=Bacillus thermotolerans TaxID=1221996 RepID=A0A0F5HMA2_BACTR|nr:DUF421 domain-containing protein [Bacillus thermotolerans]KKB33812.1 hypothetical protein QY96_00394 [Bacillus thermotolerans]KKB34421.1 hypothetical protein QY97_02494 [Bacillus thermotolerans]KKB38165.1 hypothetical protein QY95_02620 [Bacillus thermotolerans]